MEDKVRAQLDRGLLGPGSLSPERIETHAGRNPGAELGAASLALGSVFALMAPAALILAHLLEASHYAGFSRSDSRLAALGGYGAVFLILALAAVGLTLGIMSITSSRRDRRPIALGLAGVLLNGLDLFLWAGAGLAWHSSAWNML